MPFLKDLEHKISRVEHFDVRFNNTKNGRNKRGDSFIGIPSYRNKRALDGESTVEEWKERIKDFPNFLSVQVLHADGTPARADCKLSKIRSGYLKKADKAIESIPRQRYEISRKYPGCFLFMIDQSKSMADPFGGEKGTQKDEEVAQVVNDIISEIIIKNTSGNVVNDRFVVGVIGYGRTVGSAFSGNMSRINLLKLSDLESNAKIVERSEKVGTGDGGYVERKIKHQVWIEPVAEDRTPMRKAFKYAHEVLSRWISQHWDSYPPIVIHATDGDSTDGNPASLARKLTSLATVDGNVLLLNCHISSNRASPERYPSSAAGLQDKFSKRLFEMSSIMPERMRNISKEIGINMDTNARGFVFNAGLSDFVKFIEIGTGKGGG